MSLGAGRGYQVFANVINVVARPQALSEEQGGICPFPGLITTSDKRATAREGTAGG